MKGLLILLFIFALSSASQAQSKVVLQHQRRAQKQVEISPDQILRYRLKDKTRHTGRIQSFNISEIVLMQYDSSLVTLPIDEIELISDFGYRDTRWLEPFAYVAFGAAMTLGATPLIWAVGGSEKALEGLEFAGILTAASAPPLIIGSRPRRYKLKRWRIDIK